MATIRKGHGVKKGKFAFWRRTHSMKTGGRAGVERPEQLPPWKHSSLLAGTNELAEPKVQGFKPTIGFRDEATLRYLERKKEKNRYGGANMVLGSSPPLLPNNSRERKEISIDDFGSTVGVTRTRHRVAGKNQGAYMVVYNTTGGDTAAQIFVDRDGEMVAATNDNGETLTMYVSGFRSDNMAATPTGGMVVVGSETHPSFRLGSIDKDMLAGEMFVDHLKEKGKVVSVDVSQDEEIAFLQVDDQGQKTLSTMVIRETEPDGDHNVKLNATVTSVPVVDTVENVVYDNREALGNPGAKDEMILVSNDNELMKVRAHDKEFKDAVQRDGFVRKAQHEYFDAGSFDAAQRKTRKTGGGQPFWTR